MVAPRPGRRLLHLFSKDHHSSLRVFLEKSSILRGWSLCLGLRSPFRGEPWRIPAEEVAGQARDEDLPALRRGDHMARAFHCAENLAGFDLDLHDPARQRVVGDVLDVVAMSDYPHLVVRSDEQSLRGAQV